MQKPWSLYNKDEKLRIDDLRPEHVRIILLAIPTSRMGDWYACQEGDIHWQPIAAIPEFYEDVRQLKGKDVDSGLIHAAPKSAEPEPTAKKIDRRPLFEEAAPEFSKTAPTVDVDVSHTKERRTARRYPRQLMFQVVHGKEKFQCETHDISMSGLSLSQTLPAWVPKSFQAELSHGKRTIQIMCSRVSDNQLKLSDAESWDVIRAWIVSF